MPDNSNHLRFCASPSHPTRRQFLRIGALGGFGLTLPDLLRLRAQGGTKPEQPATSCILIWLAGGISHLDTFDMKPRASDIRGEFKPVPTAVPGIQVCELLPQIARQMRRITIVRSMTTPEGNHSRAVQHLLTGYRPSTALEYPTYGSVVAQQRGLGGLLPPYVAIPNPPEFVGCGYLSAAYRPFDVGGDPSKPDFRVRNLQLAPELDLERIERRRTLVADLDHFAREVEPTDLVRGRESFYTQAYDMLTSARARAAFDLQREPVALRERYGRTALGQGCLLARRLAEAGVGFLTLSNPGWDTHRGNFSKLKSELLPPFDRAFSALVEDLAERGMLERTLVIAMGEFGRTPRVNEFGGRDHWPRAGSLLVAGGGTAGGHAVGRTDERGEAILNRPVTPADLAYTMFDFLGIDPEAKTYTADGRPVQLVSGGRPIPELMPRATS